jgi:hypothetical protein
MKSRQSHLPVKGSIFELSTGRCLCFYTFLLFSGLLACSNPGSHDRSKETKQSSIRDNFSLSTFQLEKGEGYGYEILNNSHIIIHQEFIPALEGKQLFRTREDAVKIGNEVLRKIQNRKPPGITKEEVIRLLGKNTE